MHSYTRQLRGVLLSCMVLTAFIPVTVMGGETTVTNSVTVSSHSGGQSGSSGAHGSSHASVDITTTINGETVTDVHKEETSDDGTPVTVEYQGTVSTEDEEVTSTAAAGAVSHTDTGSSDTKELSDALAVLAELLKHMLSYVSLR